VKYYINYADENFKAQQDFASVMAKRRGGFDNVTCYTKDDIGKAFYEFNKHILDQKRGGGYWLWKPYFIHKKLQEIKDGDYLFYSDSGAFFLKNVDFLINELTEYNQDIMGFELPLIEKQWTKKELFTAMSCDSSEYYESHQVMSAFMLIKKTKLSVEFYKKYLEFSQNEINITDKYDVKVKQDEFFIAHRHDQSIFSLLYKSYKLRPFKDATQYGKYPKEYSGSKEEYLETNIIQLFKNGRLFRTVNYLEKYENVIFHNRKGHPVSSFIKFKIREILFKVNIYKGFFT
jgi:hypothetical protein